MKFKFLNRRLSVKYIFPLALPVLIGIILPVLEFQNQLQESDTLIKTFEAFEEFEELLERDQDGDRSDVLRQAQRRALIQDTKFFIVALSKNIAISIISVDVWAITTLFTLSHQLKKIKNNPSDLYAYPLMAIFIHIILVAMCNSIATPRANWRITTGCIFMSISVLTGISVREVIWINIDSLESE